MDRTALFGDPRWRIALDRPPVIASAGVLEHGRRGDEQYLLPDLWCMHFYLYEVELHIGGVPHFIEPGCVTIVPPNVSMWYCYTTPVRHCYVHFREAEHLPGRRNPVPPLIDLGTSFEPIYAAMLRGVAANESAPYRLTSRVWELLCTVAERMEAGDARQAPSAHPAVRLARELIELRLADEISVEHLAAEVAVSKSYLAKLFRKACGDTVAGYIVARRTARAFHLLANTTMPITAIAQSVGMPDLQQFNKAIRHRYGSSPRAVRSLGATLASQSGQKTELESNE
jgi:AraC-like DNA-binding protein